MLRILVDIFGCLFHPFFLSLSLDEILAAILFKEIPCQICWAGIEGVAMFTVGYYIDPDSNVTLLAKTCYQSNCYSSGQSENMYLVASVNESLNSPPYKQVSCYYNTWNHQQVNLTKTLSAFGIAGIVSAFVAFPCLCILFASIGKCCGIKAVHETNMPPVGQLDTDHLRSFRPAGRTDSNTSVQLKTCANCDTPNTLDAFNCVKCGEVFSNRYT